MIGIIISVVIVLFVIGNVMALRPSGMAIRRDKLRILATKLELSPHLVPCPKWIRGEDNEFGKGMLAEYCLVFDDTKLLTARYKIIKDNNDVPQLRPVIEQDKNTSTDFSLDKQPLDLPISLQPFIKGIEIKINGICVYWDDKAYLNPNSNPNYQTKNTENDLLALKNKLLQWVKTINQ